MITKENKRLIYGMLVGDGYIAKRDGYLRIVHQIKQKEYLIWKRNLLENAGIPCTPIIQFSNNGFQSVKTQTRMCNGILKPIRREIYTPYKKFPKEILELFTPLELCIWYFDDGGLSQKKKNGIVVANDLIINTGLQKTDNQTYIDYFAENWNIKFTQVKNHNCYRLRCGTKEARKFIKIISPYAKEVPCMWYKCNIKSSSRMADEYKPVSQILSLVEAHS